MQKSTKKKLLLLTLCIVLAAALALFVTGCGSSAASSAASESVQAEAAVESAEAAVSAQEPASTEPAEAAEAAGEMQVIGEGSTVFTFTVIDGDGNETDFEIHTDDTTVGAALLNAGLIAGEDSEYGLYVKEVNGITADYDTDGTYWAFYIDDEYASTGVDATDVVAGTVYSFRVEQ